MIRFVLQIYLVQKRKRKRKKSVCFFVSVLFLFLTIFLSELFRVLTITVSLTNVFENINALNAYPIKFQIPVSYIRNIYFYLLLHIKMYA